MSDRDRAIQQAKVSVHELASIAVGRSILWASRQHANLHRIVEATLLVRGHTDPERAGTFNIILVVQHEEKEDVEDNYVVRWFSGALDDWALRKSKQEIARNIVSAYDRETVASSAGSARLKAGRSIENKIEQGFTEHADLSSLFRSTMTEVCKNVDIGYGDAISVVEAPTAAVAGDIRGSIKITAPPPPPPPAWDQGW